MNYTLEIEEDDRTLEFQLDVEFKVYILNFKIKSVQVFNKYGESPVIDGGIRLDNAKRDYTSTIENMLKDSEDLFDAWIKSKRRRK